jgi:hypothetical protein
MSCEALSHFKAKGCREVERRIEHKKKMGGGCIMILSFFISDGNANMMGIECFL